MALALTQEITDVDEVAQSSLDAFLAAGEVADLMSWDLLFLGEPVDAAPATPVVVARSSRAMECVLPHHARPADYVPGFNRMRSEDWTVRVLVHCSEIGAAHTALRRVPVTLQPWWFDGGTVRFGRPEIP